MPTKAITSRRSPSRQTGTLSQSWKKNYFLQASPEIRAMAKILVWTAAKAPTTTTGSTPPTAEP
jgi:hypothetical protein